MCVRVCVCVGVRDRVLGGARSGRTAILRLVTLVANITSAYTVSHTTTDVAQCGKVTAATPGARTTEN